jgi:uncharacterized protein HemY
MITRRLNGCSRVRTIGLLLAASLISGCASTGQQGPVIVEDNSRKAPPAASKPAVVKETPKIIPKPVTQSQNGATQTLLARANEALASQQPETAIMLLERAVRIEPREALLWIRLSRAHLAQGEMRAAFQHARKAIALAGSDSSKFSAAWLQLANVFTAQGKNAEAQQIRRRFSRSSG